MRLTPLIAVFVGGCATDDWHLPADACARCDEPDVVDVGAARDVVDGGGCEEPAVRDLALGHNNFACALRCDGSVWCWGVNTHGQLGDETTVSRSTPVRVRGLGGEFDRVDLNAGIFPALALLGPGATLGTTRLRSRVNIDFTALTMGYGISDDLTVGFILPYSHIHTGVGFAMSGGNVGFNPAFNAGLPIGPGNFPFAPVGGLVTPMGSAGVQRLLTVDLHADQIQGFFDIPVDNIYATPILLGDIWKQEYPNLMAVSPDVGGVVRARAFAKRLECDLAIIDKRRPKANVSEVMNIIGDVTGRTCVIMDDMVDTAGTLCKAAQALKEHGAARVLAYCTHAVLSGEALNRIQSSDLDQLVVTDTIPLSPAAQACDRIRVVSIAELLAETLLRISNEESVSSLFME